MGKTYQRLSAVVVHLHKAYNRAPKSARHAGKVRFVAKKITQKTGRVRNGAARAGPKSSFYSRMEIRSIRANAATKERKPIPKSNPCCSNKKLNRTT